MLITSTVEICIQQLGRVEEIVLPHDAAVSGDNNNNSYASAVLGVVTRNSVRLSVRPSVTRVLCN